MMQASEQGIALIKRFEGFFAVPYICPAGKNTIGYGHVIRMGQYFPEPLSEDDAQKLLLGDIKTSEQAVNRLVTSSINQNQFDALISFIYNIGVAAFEKSTLLRMINLENPDVSGQFARWVHINGKISAGLVARRAAEKALFCA